MTLIIAFAGLISGLCSAGMIALINASLHRSDSYSGILVLGVIGVGLSKVATGALSQWMLARFSQSTSLDLTVELSRQVLTAQYQRLEETGTHRILTALNKDVLVLVGAVQAIPTLAVNIAVVVGCGIYLAWLFPLGFAVLSTVVILGIAIYKFLHNTAANAIAGARDQQDYLMQYCRSLVDGIKELKMNRNRSEEFLSKTGRISSGRFSNNFFNTG